MKKLFSLSLLFVVTFLVILTQTAFAHDEQAKTIGSYKISIDQTPLSPLKDEKVSISFNLEDTSGHHPATNIAGEIVVLDITSGERTVLKQKMKADANGSTEFEYAFPQAGMYDVEYKWKDSHGDYSTGKEIQVREPASFFDPTDFQNNVWFLMGIILVGMIIGAFVMFILLTTTLHPKK